MSGGKRRRRPRWTRRPKEPPVGMGAPTADEPAFPPDAAVEVRVDEEGFYGSWFEATVERFAPARRPRTPALYTVRYSHLVADDSGATLFEQFAPSHIRPPPPPPGEGEGRTWSFPLHGIVEAFHNDGWWSGIVLSAAAADGQDAVTVAFPVTREVITFPARLVRPRRDYVDGEWVTSKEVIAIHPKSPVRAYEVGEKVEVVRNREVYGYSWFPATVAKVVDRLSYLVEYTDLEEADGGRKEREYLHWQLIRPAVEQFPQASEFQLGPGAKVEVYCDGAWSPAWVHTVAEDGECVVSVDGEEGEVMVTKVSELLKPPFKWNGKNWKIDRVKRSDSMRQCESANSRGSPVDVASDDDEQGHHTEFSAMKRQRKEVQQVQVMSTDGSEHASGCEMDTPLSDLCNSPPRNQSMCQHKNGVCNTVVNEEIQSYMMLSKGQVTTPLCGTSADEAHGDVTSGKQKTLESPLVVQALKIHKDMSFSSIPEKMKTMQELLQKGGASQNVQIKFNGNKDFYSRDITCGLSDSRECNTSSPLGKDIRPFDVVSRGIDSGSNTKILEKSAKKKGFKKSHSLPTSLDATSTIQYNRRKKSTVRLKRSFSELEIETEERNQVSPVLPIVPPGFESNLHGERFCDVRDEELAASAEVDTQVAEINRLEKPLSLDNSVEQEGGEVAKRPIPLSSVNVESSHHIVDNTVLRGSSFAGSSMESHVPEELPFTKLSLVWSQIESMDVFQKIPQQPHFRPLSKENPALREGMALGFMVTYDITFAKVKNLSIADSNDSIEENIKTVNILDQHGFNVQCLRDSLQNLLEVKANYTKFIEERDRLKSKVVDKKSVVSELDTLLGEKVAVKVQHEREVERLGWEARKISETRDVEELELSRLKEKASNVQIACCDAQQKFQNILSDLP